MEPKIEIVKELSLLYELSLSVGGTLDLDKTAESFLKVWMRQKNIDYGAIWIKNEHISNRNPDFFSLIYAHPSFSVSKIEREFPTDFYEKLKTQKAIKLVSGDPEFGIFVKDNNSKFSIMWVIEVPHLGFMLFLFHKKNPSQHAFGFNELKKASKVFEKLSFALKSCFLHNRVVEETEQKIRFQKEMRKLALVAEKTDNAILITDKDGRIEWANDGFSRISGYTLEEAVGKTIGGFLEGPETNQETLSNISNLMGQEQSFRAELLNYSKTGKKYWMELSIQPIYDEDRNLINFIAVESDITDRKNKEVELNAAKEKAEEAGRVKQEFLSVVSHEIRTPLIGIIGMSNMLQKTQLTPQQSDYLNTIQVSTENLSLIINSILDFSKIESRKLSIQAIPFDLKKILQNLINSNEFKAEEKGLGLFLKIDSKIKESLIGDGIRLGQVLLNLVSNAIKFTTQGKIEIEVRLVSKMKNALVLEFSVADTGKGIPLEMQKVIFDSFTQEDSSFGRKYGGTGLGLSISQKLVSLMGGELMLESKENIGTKVSFVLGFPVNQGLSVETENQKGSENLLIGKKILVVEDNTMNQFFVQKLLEGWGVAVDIAYNGRKGVEMFKAKYYDGILMDLQMPEMDGIEATKLIRKENEYIPIIALTALVVEEEIENFKAAGLNDFITKPFEAEVLRRKLNEHILSHEKYSISGIKVTATAEKELYNNSLLKQMMKGNLVQVKQMEILFAEQAEEIALKMDAYLAQEKWMEISLLAHKIKASIDMMQINSLKQPIRTLEGLGKNSLEKEKIEELISLVSQTLIKVCNSLKLSNS